MFDAGAIEAQLRIDRSQFQRDLAEARAEGKKFSEEKFNASLGFDDKAMKNLESRLIAIQRALGGIQTGNAGLIGSDPQLLKRLEMAAAQPGGIGILGTGTDNTLNRLLRQNLEKQAQGIASMGTLGTGAGGSDTSRAAAAAANDVTNSNQENTSEIRRLTSTLNRLFGGGGSGGGGSGGGGDSSSFFGRLFHGIGPAVSGIGAGNAFKLAAAGPLLGALPALLGPLAALGVGGAGAGVVALGAKELIGSKAHPGELYGAAQTADASLKAGLNTAIAPLAGPLLGVLKSIPAIMQSVIGPLKDLFSGAATLVQPLIHSIADLARDILPQLGKAFRLVAPVLEPLVNGIGQLVGNIIKGLLPALAAVGPIVKPFAEILAHLGTDVGALFADMAPAFKASAVVLKAVFDIIGGLLPIIAKLADIFAKYLAPAVGAFAQVINALHPTIILVGKILAALAGAILGDLSAAFMALATLIKDISPSLNILAHVLASMFGVLENSGVFAVLGNAVEKIVPQLAKLVNTLVIGLAPVLPVLVRALGEFAITMAGLLAAGLSDVLTALIPIVGWLANLTDSLLKHIGPALIWIIGIWKLLSIALDTNPFILIITGVLLLAGVIIKYHTQIWQFIVRIWGDIARFFERVWNDIWGFAKQWWPLILGPAGLIVKYHEDIWRFIQRIWRDVIGFFVGVWRTIWGDTVQTWNDITGFFSRVFGGIKRGFQDVVNFIGRVWGGIQSTFSAPVRFLVNTVYDNGIARLWNDVMGAIGGPKLPILKFGSGGKLDGYGGGDRRLALLEDGEAVVDKQRTARYAPLLKAMGVPGFQGGGLIGGIVDFAKGLFSGGSEVASIIAALATGNTKALSSALGRSIHTNAAGELATMMIALPEKLVSYAVGDISHFIGGLFSRGGPQPSGHAASNAALARQMVPGWSTGAYWTAWNNVAMRESGWNNLANNPSSGAYGIAQALPFTKYPKPGWPGWAGGSSDPYSQILWMASYMAGRYGGPIGAWNHEVAYGWYDKGGYLMPGLNLALNTTGRPERVVGPGDAAGGPLIGTYQTAFYGVGDTTEALRELTRVLKSTQQQAAVIGR